MFHFYLSAFRRYQAIKTGLCIFGGLMLLLVTPLAAQQNYLEIPVQLEIEDGNMNEVVVKIKKDGKDAFTQSGASRLRFKLDFQRKYTLVFTKPGYVSKTIEVNTKVPAERLSKGFEAYRIGVKLQKQNENNPVAYKQPVAQIKFDTMLDEFNFETDYSKSLLAAMQDPDASPKKDTSDASKTLPTENLPTPHQSENTLAADRSENAVEQETTRNPEGMQAAGSVTAEPTALGKMEDTKTPANENMVQGTADKGTTAQIKAPAFTEAENIQREDIVEKNKLITCFTVEKNGITTEYRRVLHHWGGLYYFKNKTTSITENHFVAATGYAGD